MEEEAASFSTEMFSMSSGFRLFMLPSIPSIKISGEALDPLPMVPVPRMFTFIVCPNCPPKSGVDRFNPGTTPCRACPTCDTGREASALVSTLATAPVKFTFFWVPKPTTTTSSSVFESSLNSILKDVWAPLREID